MQWEERCAEALRFPWVCIFLSEAPLCLLSPDSGVCSHPSPGLVLVLCSDRSTEMRNKRNSSLSHQVAAVLLRATLAPAGHTGCSRQVPLSGLVVRSRSGNSPQFIPRLVLWPFKESS